MTGDGDQLPTCFSCEFDGQNFPCRDRDGNLSPERLAPAILLCCRRDVGSPQYEASLWASDCLDELVADAPQTALQIIISALPLFNETREIAVLAAGPVENLLIEHGAKVIERIEGEAERSERFRYLLSGTWGRPHIDPEVWRRLQAAVMKGPWLDEDFRTPQGSLKWDKIKKLKP